jgi:hypothetical protein
MIRKDKMMQREIKRRGKRSVRIFAEACKRKGFKTLSKLLSEG